MRDAGLDEFELYSADPPVIHVRWRHTVGACFRVCHCHITYAVDREAVVEATVVAQNAAVAVGGVLAEADVGDDEERREMCFYDTEGMYYLTLGVVGCGTEGVFHVRGDRDTEEDYRAETFPYKRFEVGNEFVDPAAVLVGEGRNKGLLFSLVGYEERVDEH